MLRRLGATDDASVGFAVAWDAALIPVEFYSPDASVSLVERALELVQTRIAMSSDPRLPPASTGPSCTAP